MGLVAEKEAEEEEFEAEDLAGAEGGQWAFTEERRRTPRGLGSGEKMCEVGPFRVIPIPNGAIPCGGSLAGRLLF